MCIIPAKRWKCSALYDVFLYWNNNQFNRNYRLRNYHKSILVVCIFVVIFNYSILFRERWISSSRGCAFLTKKNSENTRKLFLQELSVVSMTDMELVEMKGVEPSTSRMRTERSPTELHPHIIIDLRHYITLRKVSSLLAPWWGI